MAMPQGKQGYRRSVNGYKFGKAKLAKATAVEEVITSSLCELAANSAGIPTELLFLFPFLSLPERNGERCGPGRPTGTGLEVSTHFQKEKDYSRYLP